GASAYDVWFDEPNKIVRTKTNAADEREYYTFHQQSPWPDVVHWRVRAVRKTYGDLPNRLPTVSYGPWSALQTSINPTFATGPLRDVAAVSDATSTATPSVHRLTPAFAFAGNQVAANPDINGKPAPLYRVYVFSDSDCVNVVFKGALVGSPAYAPRMTGPLDLPGLVNQLVFAPQQYLKDGTEGKTFMRDSSPIQTTESDKPPANPASGNDSGGGFSPLSTIVIGDGETQELALVTAVTDRVLTLSMPLTFFHEVGERVFFPQTLVEYHELDQPQDACAAGRVQAFGKTNEPAVTVSGAPFVTGLSPTGRLVQAAGSKPSFYGSPLVAWKPALGAEDRKSTRLNSSH